MKARLHIYLTAIATLCLTPSSSPAASFTEAKISRMEKDVKVLKENAAPHAASVGEIIKAVTSVATGPGSRAELVFPDTSLTRLGANSRFTFRGQGHTIDLDKGVLVFQVPEKLRDAKVRTAAVTAAVTGGTLIIEYLPGGFIKIMCVGGNVDASLTGDPSKFISLKPGQMIIQPANATTMGQPVDFDLKLLLKTSKLISGDSDREPDAKEIANALKKQQEDIKDGDLVKTNLIIPGLGTVVQIDNNERFIIPPGPPGGPPPGSGPPGGGPSGGPPGGPTFQGVVPLIRGTTVINRNTFIKVDPQIKAFNVITNNVLLSDGSAYRPGLDGPFSYFGFGVPQISEPNLQGRLAEKGNWSAYKFEQLLINGTPEIGDYFPVITFDISPFDAPPPLPRNIILSSLNNILLADRNALPDDEGSPGNADYNPSLDIYDFDNLLLYSQNGSVLLERDFMIEGDVDFEQDLSIVGAGPGSDVTINGNIELYGDASRLLISAGRDLLVDSNVTADDIIFRGGRDVTINGTGGSYYDQYTVEAEKGNLLVSAKRNIKITNSAQLKALSELSPEALIRLESLEGDITIDGDSTIRGTNIEIEALKGNVSIVDSTLTATHALKARTLRPDGTLLIAGSSDRPTVLNAGLSELNPKDLIRLYAEGSNGKVLFQGNVTLNSDEVQIAGKTVQVDSGGNVRVTQGNAHIFSDNHNYRINGAGSAPYGTIDVSPYGNVRQYNFDDTKPHFKTGGKIGRGGPPTD